MFNEILIGIIVNIIVAVLTFICTTAWHNRRRIRIMAKSIFSRNKDARISYSYLFKIRYKDKYLLVRGNNIEQYQPIGGVYKYYDSFNDKKNKWKLVDDSPENFYKIHDLRMRTKCRYIPYLISWFESRMNREVSVFRELVEELNIANKDIKRLVTETRIEFKKTVIEPIKFNKHYKVCSHHIYDIFEASINNDVIEKALKCDNFILVNSEDIQRACVMHNNLSKNIGSHAKYIL